MIPELTFHSQVAVAWGVLYLTLEAVPLVYINVYGFSAGEVGLIFYSVV